MFGPQKKHHRTRKHGHWHKEKEDRQDVTDDATDNKIDNKTDNKTDNKSDNKSDNATDNATDNKENHEATPVEKFDNKPPKEKRRPRSATFSTASMMAMMPLSDLAADLKWVVTVKTTGLYFQVMPTSLFDYYTNILIFVTRKN